jgi:uncharacterized protein
VPSNAATEDDRRLLPVVSYFVLAFGWAWSFWLAAAAMGLSVEEPPGSLLYLLGVFGPLVGAAWVVRQGGRAYRREFVRRVWDPRRITAPWWGALLAVVAGPALVAGLVTTVAGTAATAPDYGAAAVIGMVAFALVAGVVEEPGWRGAASDAWQARTRPVWAATGIGVLWSLWHLPLHFFEGSYFHGLELGSARLWLTHLLLALLGVLYVWLANGSGGSILIAILAHAGFNVAYGLVPESLLREVIVFLVVAVAASVVVAATRGRLCFPSTTSPRSADGLLAR